MTHYCKTIADMTAHLAALAKEGYLIEAAITAAASGATYQPAAFVYRNRIAALQTVRLNAMAEGTHYAKRTSARSAAETIIAAASATTKTTETN